MICCPSRAFPPACGALIVRRAPLNVVRPRPSPTWLGPAPRRGQSALRDEGQTPHTVTGGGGGAESSIVRKIFWEIFRGRGRPRPATACGRETAGRLRAAGPNFGAVRDARRPKTRGRSGRGDADSAGARYDGPGQCSGRCDESRLYRAGGTGRADSLWRIARAGGRARATCWCECRPWRSIRSNVYPQRQVADAAAATFIIGRDMVGRVERVGSAVTRYRARRSGLVQQSGL